MSFLALTIWQMLALAAATTAAIVGLYLLKPPPKTVEVPSILLWSRLIKEKKSSSDRLRWWLSLLLALAIGLSIALALGRPEPNGLAGDSRRLAVIIDNSPTMATRTSDGRTRWDHAVEEARRILMEGHPNGEFLVADTAGQIVAPVFEYREDAWAKLDSLRLSAPGLATFPQLMLGEEAAFFVTDGVMVDASKVGGARIVSVFEPAPNVGITQFEIRPLPVDPTRYEAFVEVLNGGREAREVNLILSGSGEKRVRQTARIPAGNFAGFIFNMDTFSGGAIRAAVTSPGDSLDLDNHAYAYLPIHSTLRVILVAGESRFLESFFHPRIELYRLAPEEFREIPSADVYVMDQFAPEEPPNRPTLFIRPPERSWLPPSDTAVEVETPAVTAWEKEHEILQSVSLEDLVVGRAVRMQAGEGRVLVSSDETPLIVAGETAERWLILSFALEESNFPLTAGFPIFLSNALTWLVGEPGAVAQSAGLIEIHDPEARITTLLGDAVTSRETGGSRIFEAPGPGIYSVTTGAKRSYITVNVTEPAVSGTNRTSIPEGREQARIGDSPTAVAGNQWYDELWILLLAVAVGLLSLEWWTYNRRMTI